MYWNFEQTINFTTQHFDDFLQLSDNPQSLLVLCPSSTVLYSLAQKFSSTAIALGAQDCSSYTSGAYTGQISASDVKSSGAAYCIIGHSERRKYNAETDEEVAGKCLALTQEAVTPIVCIGETLKQHQEGQTLQTLQQQLDAVVKIVDSNRAMFQQHKLLIAYEPVWAIGTGLIPTQSHLEEVFAWLRHFAAKNMPDIDCVLIYGGSVSSKNIHDLKKISFIQGFLVGGASLDFDEFYRIVRG